MRFELTILGSSSALPTSERFPTAHVLNVHERFFLIDCAEGTQVQIRRYRLPLGRINHVFISHLHGDHYFGLPGLISSMGLLGRKVPLHIFAPPGLKSMVSSFSPVTDQPGFEVIYHEHKFDAPEVVLCTERLEVTTIPLVHKIPTVGFLFREKSSRFIKGGIPRSYAFISDTKYSERAMHAVTGVDLLYHEATYLHLHHERAWITGHSTAREAAYAALVAGAGRLVIGHFSARYRNLDALMDEASDIFANTIKATDGLKIEIPLRKESDL